MFFPIALFACSRPPAPVPVEPAPAALDRDAWNDRAALLAPHFYRLDEGEPVWVWQGGTPGGAEVPVALDAILPADARQTLVAEELARLRAHVAHFEATLAGGGAVGRKLDFLTQELFREANTLGTKTPDVTITHLVVELKTTLERIREQVQNAL